MSQEKVLPWIDPLPEVGDPIRKEREAIEAKLKEAAEIRCRVYVLQQEAYQAALKLDSRVKELWSADEIERAKAKACPRATF